MENLAAVASTLRPLTPSPQGRTASASLPPKSTTQPRRSSQLSISFLLGSASRPFFVDEDDDRTLPTEDAVDEPVANSSPISVSVHEDSTTASALVKGRNSSTSSACPMNRPHQDATTSVALAQPSTGYPYLPALYHHLINSLASVASGVVPATSPSTPSPLHALSHLLFQASSPVPSPWSAYQQHFLHQAMALAQLQQQMPPSPAQASPASVAQPQIRTRTALRDRSAVLESILSRAEERNAQEARGGVKREREPHPSDDHFYGGFSSNTERPNRPAKRRRTNRTSCSSDDEASSCRKVAKRKPATPRQVVLLEQVFAVEPTPTSTTKLRLAEVLNMSPKRVTVWFKNKRARQKKKGIPLPNSSSSPYSSPSPRRRHADYLDPASSPITSPVDD
jgi:hypothetical protein